MFFWGMTLTTFSFRLDYDFLVLERILIEFSGGECCYFDVVNTEMREIILAHFILCFYFHSKFAQRRCILTFLVTVYFKVKVLELPVKIRFWESQDASNFSPDLHSSATTSQTGSGL